MHLVPAKALTSTSAGVMQKFEQTYLYPSTTLAKTRDRMIKASTNQLHRYDGINKTKNQTPNIAINHVTKFMA